jgi:ribA/ribD-fused uncharacterized protein
MMTERSPSDQNGSNVGKTVQVRVYDPAAAAVFCKTAERFGGLSNMAGGFPLRVNGVNILTSEALYQACRFPHLPKIQQLIIEQRSPMTAKMKSKPYRSESRIDWESVRVRIMRWCLRVKLAQNWDAFGDLLRSTDDLPIVELSRKDDFWGAKPQEDGTLVGINVLGRLLMELREQFKRATEEDLKRVEPVPIANFLLFGTPIGVVQCWRATAPHLTDPDLTPPHGALWGPIGGPLAETNLTENLVPVRPNNHAEPISHAGVEQPASPQLGDSETCYSRCLPLLLQWLRREEPGDKQLAGIAKSLDVLPKQLKTWIERSIQDGKVERTKKSRKLVYSPVAPKQDPPLFPNGNTMHEIRTAEKDALEVPCRTDPVVVAPAVNGELSQPLHLNQ